LIRQPWPGRPKKKIWLRVPLPRASIISASPCARSTGRSNFTKNVAMLPLGASNGDPRIELIEAATPDSVIGKFIEKRGEGLHHVALRVPDLASTVERLRSSGAHILNEPRAGAGGHLYVFVHPSSTGGVLLELIQA
jgi:methylmalonyl-CoA epimerase